MVYNFFDKRSASGSGVTKLANKSAFSNEIKQMNSLLKDYSNHLLKKVKKEQFIPDSKTIFVVLI